MTDSRTRSTSAGSSAWSPQAGRPGAAGQLEAERAPVGRAVLRFTNRLFTLATTANPLARVARTWLVAVLAPLPLRSTRPRAAAFGTVSELAVGDADPAVPLGQLRANLPATE